MLPSNLLIARVRRGYIKPLYVDLSPENLGIARDLIDVFKAYVGRRKGDLQEELRGYEDMGWDYRFIRGLATLLERRCRFEAKSLRDPLEARRLVFQEAEKRGGVTNREERLQVLSTVAEALEVSVEELEEILWSDLDEELVLEYFEPIDPRDLLQWYNLSLTQTLLFLSLIHI